jgi:hypothetical protein
LRMSTGMSCFLYFDDFRGVIAWYAIGARPKRSRAQLCARAPAQSVGKLDRKLDGGRPAGNALLVAPGTVGLSETD